MVDLSWSIVPALRFGEHAAAWDRLNAQGFNTPLLASTFVAEALTQLGRGDELLALARRGDEPVAACLLHRQSPFRWQSFDASQLPLCPWLQQPGVAIGELLASLMEALPRHVILLSLIRLDPLKTPRPAASRELSTLDNIVTGQIVLPGTFDEYLAGLSRKFIAKLRRRLAKAQQALGPLELQVAQDAQAVAAGVHDFALLESSGWKHAAGTAVEVGGAQFGFYQVALRRMARQGEARVFTLRLGGRLAAAQLALVRDSRLYLLKSAYDESLREFGPGVMLKWLLIEAVLAAEPPVRRIELYGRLIESHQPFVTGSRETYHLNCFRGRMVAWVHKRARRLRRREAA